jgi:hypothetical protein
MKSSKSKIISQQKLLKIAIPLPEYYNEHYPCQYYDSNIKTIQECAKVFDSHLVETAFNGVKIKGGVFFPFNLMLRRMRLERKYAINFPWNKFEESIKRNDLSICNDAIIYKEPKSFDFKLGINMEIRGYISDKEVDCFDDRAEWIVEKFLFDLFCVANLADPGALDFWGISRQSSLLNFRLRLIGITWFGARYKEMEKIVPVVTLNVEQVYAWYSKIMGQTADSGNNAASQALTSLMQFSRYDSEKPIDNIYLLYSLESLYGSNQSLLKKRVKNVFNKSSCHELDKALNFLFEWRNKLVHGSLKLPHPLGYGEAYDSYEDNYFKSRNIGFQIVLASIQKLIEMNAKEFEFKEIVNYKSV